MALALAKGLATQPSDAHDYRQSRKIIEEKSKAPIPSFYFRPLPHSPIVPLERFQEKTQAGPYGDFIAQTDHSVGQIVAALQQSGVYDNTLIIVSSDNGPAPFMRDLIKEYDHNPSGSLRGLKRDLLEGGHRVPFIASWPNRGIKDGRRLDSTLSLTDLFAFALGSTSALPALSTFCVFAAVGITADFLLQISRQEA